MCAVVVHGNCERSGSIRTSWSSGWSLRGCTNAHPKASSSTTASCSRSAASASIWAGRSANDRIAHFEHLAAVLARPRSVDHAGRAARVVAGAERALQRRVVHRAGEDVDLLDVLVHGGL